MSPIFKRIACFNYISVGFLAENIVTLQDERRIEDKTVTFDIKIKVSQEKSTISVNKN